MNEKKIQFLVFIGIMDEGYVPSPQLSLELEN